MPPRPRQRHSDDETVLFIADLHLDPTRPRMIEAFTTFCAGPARHATTVYILGDLFEAWIGDDDDDPAWRPIRNALAGLTAAGVAVYFMAGNRDFLLGDAFARATGIVLIDDPTLIELAGHRTLLCHGDTLCTDDTDYQDFRARVRAEEWQRSFLAKPVAERRQIGAALRGDSQTAMAAKPAAAMDINAAATRALCEAHGAARLIHGHTHRPGHDTLAVGGRTIERWVLAAWLGTASMLRARGPRIEAITLE